jgi:hypothetical protein
MSMRHAHACAVHRRRTVATDRTALMQVYAIVTGNPFDADGRLKIIRLIIGGTAEEAADAYVANEPADGDMWWVVPVED